MVVDDRRGRERRHFTDSCSCDRAGATVDTRRKITTRKLLIFSKLDWRRGWGSLKRFAKTPMDTGIFGATLATSTIWRLPIPAGACIHLRPLADFSIAMSLDMTLAARDFASFHVRGSSEASRHCPARVDRRGSTPGRPSKGLCRNDDVFSKRRGDWNGLLVFD